MTTLEALEHDLPWGFHDAYLEGLDLDVVGRRLALRLRLMVSARQDLDQRALVEVTGLVYCVVEPPEVVTDDDGATTPDVGELPEDGFWIDSGAGFAPSARGPLPAPPAGCFVQWFFLREWNAFVHVCGRAASLRWLEPEPVAARTGTRAHFPGDEVPDPPASGA